MLLHNALHDFFYSYWACFVINLVVLLALGWPFYSYIINKTEAKSFNNSSLKQEREKLRLQYIKF